MRSKPIALLPAFSVALALVSLSACGTPEIADPDPGGPLFEMGHEEPPDTHEPPPPSHGEGTEGCTPGFWKARRHLTLWPAPFTPATTFVTVFEDAFPGMTLLDVVSLGGGGLNALGRHTVAALLNAQSPGVDYGMTAADVIAAFNGVFPGGDYSTLTNQFVALNERGCTVD